MKRLAKQGSITCLWKHHSGMSSIRILHFNDCYNIEPNLEEPVAGAARFKRALQSSAGDDAVVLFSGDIMGPSIITTFTRGDHVIPVLNHCNVACAVFGNHEFEFGVDHLKEFTKRTNFPWLMSNLMDARTGEPIANSRLHHVIHNRGKKLGLMGLVEKEWLSTLGTICDPEEQQYLDFVSEGAKHAKYLKEEEKVDFVIALTHMRWPNDRRLAHEVEGIDLILGGHDHDYGVEQVNGVSIVKSGSDFRTFSKIDIDLIDDHKPEIVVQKIEVTSAFTEDAELKQVLDQYTQVMESKMEVELARFGVDLDCRFAVVRSRETVLGNFAADVMCWATSADIAIVNSGTFRSDRIHAAASNFTFRDLVTILPKVSPIIVIRATGSQVHEALENGVSQFPNLEGRFPQVAGISFDFDPEKEPLQRITASDIKIRGEPIQLDKEYKLVTKSFLANGRDGYAVLKNCPVLVNEEECIPFPLCVQQYFDRMQEHVITPKLEGRIINVREHKEQQ